MTSGDVNFSTPIKLTVFSNNADGSRFDVSIKGLVISQSGITGKQVKVISNLKAAKGLDKKQVYVMLQQQDSGPGDNDRGRGRR